MTRLPLRDHPSTTDGLLSEPHLPALHGLDPASTAAPGGAGKALRSVLGDVLEVDGDLVSALREMVRVLRPDGTYVFLEHGRSNDGRVARHQDFFNPLQRRFARGCNINSRIDALIRDAGLEIRSLERHVLRDNPRIMAELYWGVGGPGER